MREFYFEVTDTFGKELNYCWLHRFIVVAKSERGAISKLSRHLGLHFRNNGLHYKAKNACIAAYIIDWEVDTYWEERAERL